MTARARAGAVAGRARLGAAPRRTRAGTAPRRARVGGLAGALALALPLAACSSPEVVQDRSWQVVGIYTSPDSPSTIPDTVNPAPSLTLGTAGLVGTTGCAQFRGRADYTHDGQPAAVDTANTLRISSIDFAAPREDCAHESLWAHNQLERLLRADNTFDLRMDKNSELVLTLQDERVDSPAIRFVSLSK
ncbi:META domain-containing protein [Corynebacterium lizhenjunii]|uniref:META domain-containing protein n=1 Tax=Corynebacterium lizhenjunii TaxID=2709394 RepID=A0A7T0KG29_9CORY|nr:META domain-containing protein [Corynebacterium lizhenjunii]QPK79479.1 META domain-containing protein [Corynebacterium lizhenjunii]